MDETFFMTNIAPQVGDGFNRHCACTPQVIGIHSYLYSQTGPIWKVGVED